MFVTLANFQSSVATKFRDALAIRGISNTFNPSICITGDVVCIAFRAHSEARRPPFNAYLYCQDVKADKTSIVNLNGHPSFSTIATIADPKLVVLDREVWATFNTGSYGTGSDIYLCRITPSIAVPWACHYDNRREMEKNWAFFMCDGKLHALYDLESRKILTGEFDAERHIITFFERDVRSSGESDLKRHSIGTQPVLVDDAHHFIAHRKIVFKGKRAYLGKMMRFSLEGNTVAFEAGHKYLFHSFRSLLGDRIKHNKNLISATYFSGLQFERGKYIVSYGINDVDFGFAEVPTCKVW